MDNFDLSRCILCPRQCGANRLTGRGICGEGAELRVAKTMLHRWEEPCVSGTDSDSKGSGAVFFYGCPLHCVYCQNGEISRDTTDNGALTPSGLAAELLRLQSDGACNINLVSPTHFTAGIIKALDIARPRLHIPVIFNTGGYERPEIISALAGYADVFLTDFKYGTSETAEKYSHAPDYPELAAAALSAMLEVAGEPRFDADGMIQSGVIVRHLVLPGQRRDSMAALDLIRQAAPPARILLSLMRQYTPEFAPPSFPELSRRVTTFEYESVRDYALSLGFSGYSQDAASAHSTYTPKFRHK